MAAQRTLLLLGAGPMQIPLIRAAHRLGVKVAAVDPRDHAPGLALADEYYLADLADEKACLTIAEKVRPDGVATFAADFPVRMVALLAERLGLPGLTPDASWAATDKNLMRETLAAAGVPCPRWRTVHNLADALVVMESLTAAAVVKPALSSGSRGITHIDPEASETSLRHAYERAHSFEGGRGVLIEDFADGPEISVEAVTHAGVTTVVAVTDKVTTGPPYWVELAHSQPTRSEQLEAIERVTLDTVRALGLEDCASHTEMRLTRTGPVVMEAAGRAGGGYIASDLVPLSTGVDFAAAVVSVALGDAPRLEATADQGAAIVFVTPTPGLVRSVAGAEEARRMPGVEAVEVEVRRGDIVPPLIDTTGRVGHVIATGADATEAMQRCRDAAAAIVVRT